MKMRKSILCMIDYVPDRIDWQTAVPVCTFKIECRVRVKQRIVNTKISSSLAKKDLSSFYLYNFSPTEIMKIKTDFNRRDLLTLPSLSAMAVCIQPTGSTNNDCVHCFLSPPPEGRPVRQSNAASPRPSSWVSTLQCLNSGRLTWQ